MALERLQVNVEGDLLRQVDAYADSLHITRTAAVSVLLSRALQADKLAADLSELMDAYRVQSGKIPVAIDELGAAVDRWRGPRRMAPGPLTMPAAVGARAVGSLDRPSYFTWLEVKKWL